MSALETLLREWDGEALVVRWDGEAEAWIFVALHSSVLGRPVGGTRLHVYDEPAAGLRDAMRLAEGMTHKWAALELPIGGGKAVLAPARPLDPDRRRGLLRRYGDLLESLRGAFGTGEDLGTTPEDMALVAESTRFVHGQRRDGSVLDPGPFTARGVLRGIEAAVREVLERDTLAGTTVAVQGVGDVGAPLARALAAAGARLTLADTSIGRLRGLAAELGAETVEPEAIHETDCDVLAPCAVGAVLDARTIPRLACRIVAGSANNQLASAADGERLHERGTVYVPDYVINAGGALAFARYGGGERDLDALLASMDRIGEAVSAILRGAAERDESPARTARRRVDEVLARARAERDARPR